MKTLGITYPVIWIFVSYFLGRYHSLLESTINYRKYLFRSLLSFVILISLVHLFTEFFKLISPPVLLVSTLISSFFLLFTLNILIRNFIKDKNNW